MEASGDRKGCERSRLSGEMPSAYRRTQCCIFKGYFPKKWRGTEKEQLLLSVLFSTLCNKQAGVSTSLPSHTERCRVPRMFHLELSDAREQSQF